MLRPDAALDLEGLDAYKRAAAGRESDGLRAAAFEAPAGGQQEARGGQRAPRSTPCAPASSESDPVLHVGFKDSLLLRLRPLE
jgi:hypothetical protein